MGGAKRKEEYLEEQRKLYSGKKVIFCVAGMRQFAFLEEDATFLQKEGMIVYAKKVCTVDPVQAKVASGGGSPVVAFNLTVFEDAKLSCLYLFRMPEGDQLYPELVKKLTLQQEKEDAKHN